MKFDLVPSVTRQWRRRWFLSSLGGLGLWGWLASREAMAARPARAHAAQAAARAPASWVLFLDHLIPADALSPSASGLQVDRQLWSEVRQDAEYQRLVVFGCQWLDRYHPQGFAGLSEPEREKLLIWMSQAPWEAPQRRFFDLVRDHAMTLYYLQPQARHGTLLEAPPQPMGRAIDRPEALLFLRKGA